MLFALAVGVLAFALAELTHTGPATTTPGLNGTHAAPAGKQLNPAERRAVLSFTRSFLVASYHGGGVRDATPALRRRLLAQPQRVTPADAHRHPHVLAIAPLPSSGRQLEVLARIGDGELRYSLRLKLTNRSGAPLVSGIRGAAR
jgi:hypothetical protein